MQPFRVLRRLTVSIAACALLLGVAVSAPGQETKPALPTINGEFMWGPNKGTFVMTLTPVGDKAYTVAYAVEWRGKKTKWKGNFKGDLNGEFTADGTQMSGGSVWTFAGKFVNGAAECDYKEQVETGPRNGKLTLKR